MTCCSFFLLSENKSISLEIDGVINCDQYQCVRENSADKSEMVRPHGVWPSGQDPGLKVGLINRTKKDPKEESGRELHSRSAPQQNRPKKCLDAILSGLDYESDE